MTENTQTQALDVRRQAPSVGEMLAGVLERGITGASVEAVEKLVGLYERMEDKKAEREFAAAFTKLQHEIPKVQATKPVPNRDGTVRYMFAPLEEIEKQVRPMCLAHGFSWSFSESESAPGKLTKLCVLQHVGGHKRVNPYSVRIGSGPPGCTESQADGAAHSYAKRGALCDALGIIIAHQDTDARAEGAPVTPEQAEELARRVAETNSNREAFLKFAGAKTFAEIASTKYVVLDGFLKKKEQRGK